MKDERMETLTKAVDDAFKRMMQASKDILVAPCPQIAHEWFLSALWYQRGLSHALKIMNGEEVE